MAFPRTLAGLAVCVRREIRAGRGRCGFALHKPAVKAVRVLAAAIRQAAPKRVLPSGLGLGVCRCCPCGLSLATVKG
ncbi:hypothetical protein VSS37_19240 [Candidatus Thiothrix sp. Deng01]|uniref:Uncharacterized protein n=1 Tax=Candidatus Thiothrix phosphatis TaxID=3112415 RepID=A0ABU6D483_9GAMM|nr:hypothetical protein [Candidatus Thiothrix sp. Deng01]MEB4593122.1 hypothetical protein [Candidatus Thiothrix sp. Deng01]